MSISRWRMFALLVLSLPVLVSSTAGGATAVAPPPRASKSGSAQSAAAAPVTAFTAGIAMSSPQVVPGGLAVYRATIATPSATSGVRGTATLPPGFTYERTLGVTVNDEAALNDVTVQDQTVRWSAIGGTPSAVPAAGEVVILFSARASGVAGSYTTGFLAEASDGASSTATTTVALSASAPTIEIDDSPFVAADAGNRGAQIPRVATIGVRVVNPTATTQHVTVNIGDGTTPGAFPGASGETCTGLTGGLGMLALEKHGAAGAATAAGRSLSLPAASASTVFFSLCYPGEARASYRYVAWLDGSGTTAATASIAVQPVVSANSQKVVGVTTRREGNTVTLRVSFDLGVVGARGVAWLQPAGTFAYDPLVTRLRSAQVTLNGTTQAPDRLYFTDLDGQQGGVVEFTFDVIGQGSTTLVPYLLGASGHILKVNGDFGSSSTITTPPSMSVAKEQRLYPSGSFGTAPVVVASGDVIEYRLTATNGGFEPATDVVLADELPADTVYVPDSAGDGSYDAGTNRVTWPAVTVEGGATIVRTFRVRVGAATPAGAQMNNTATVSSGNGGSGSSNTVSAVSGGAPDLSVAVACPSTAVLGEEATYRIDYGNLGEARASDVRLVVSLSGGHQYVDGSAQGDFTTLDVAGSTLTFGLGDLPAGTTGRTITIRSAIRAVGAVSVAASIDGAEGDMSPANDSSACAMDVDYADLYVAPSCPSSAVLGERARYEVDFGNEGSSASGVPVVVVVLDGPQAYEEGTASGGFEALEVSEDRRTLRFRVPVLGAGARGTLSFAARSTGADPLGIRATIGSSAADGDATDDEASCGSAVVAPDLFVNKSCPAQPPYGMPATYRIGFGNVGSADAPDVVLRETLGSGHDYVEGSASIDPDEIERDADGSTRLVWRLGSLRPGMSDTVEFDAVVRSTTELSSTSAITTSRAQRDTADNAAGCSSSVQLSDVFVSKTCPSDAAPGSTITHEIVYGNSGGAVATDVVVRETIGAGVEYVEGSASMPPSSSTMNEDGSRTLSFEPGPLAPGARGAIRYRLLLPARTPDGEAGTLTHNVSTRVLVGSPESSTSNNAAECSTSSEHRGRVELSKTSESGVVRAGDEVGMSIVVRNSERASASVHDVVVTDVLPPGLTFVSCAGAPCRHEGRLVAWSVGSLDVGESRLLTVVAGVGAVAGCSLCEAANSTASDSEPATSRKVCVLVTTGAPGPDGLASGAAAAIAGDLPAASPLKPDAASSSQAGPGAGSDTAETTLVEGVAHGFTATSTSTVDMSDRSAHQLSTATVPGLSILDGAIRASLVRAVAQADADPVGVRRSAVGSYLQGLVINERTYDNVAPNTTVSLRDTEGNLIGRVVLFETIAETKITNVRDEHHVADITVNMIHVYIVPSGPLGAELATDFVIGRARAVAQYREAGPCGPAIRGEVQASATLARSIVVHDSGAVSDHVLAAAGPIPSGGGHDRVSMNDGVSRYVEVDAATADAFGEVGNDAAVAEAVAHAAEVRVAGDLAVVSGIRARSHTRSAGHKASEMQGGTVFGRAIVGGVQQGHALDANRVVELPGVGFAVVNEQIRSTAGARGSLTITLLRIVVTQNDPGLGLRAGSEIWIAKVHSAARFA